jgi:tetratricopeptide (TPR) repeat protein
MVCVDENRLVWFLRGELTARGADDVAGHLDGCNSCRDLFALVATSSLLPPAPATRDEPDDELTPGTRVGRYTILSLIGEGAIGVVYAARDSELDRAIALKLLRPGTVDQDQLLREAQALARLSNPHVVGVFDVGAHGDRLFVAMELVDGVTLAEWCRARRKPREIAAVFRQLADGLAAAHEAGVVHRDIKPGNLCIGRDGRARVLDFGLAQRVALPGRTEIAGTPAYMSPEQLAGAPVDARSDQFGFCVALYEALHGERPFAGLASPGLALRPPPRGSRVPRWARRVVSRGLAARPEDRWPDMRVVGRKLVPPRTAFYAAAAIALTATAAIGLAIGRADHEVCPHVDQHAWDDSRRDAVHDAFGASGVAYAPSAWERLDHKLTDYMREWTAMRTDACEACRVRGEQSPALMDRRMACLDTRLRAVDQLAQILEHPDADAIERASDAAEGLPAIARCGDPRWLADAEPMTPQAEALATEQARIEALGGLGKIPEAAEAIERLVIAARAVGHRATLAHALSLAGMYETQAGDFERAQATLEASILAAEAGHDDETRVEAWLAKANAADRAGRAADGLRALDQAAAILERIGDDPGLAIELAFYRGALELDLGHFAAARTATEHCLELAEKHLGKDSPQLAEPLQVLGDIIAQQGKPGDAIPIFERVLALTMRDVGPDHPHVADAIEYLGVAHQQLGQLDQAIAEHRRALAIREHALGPRHRKVVLSLTNLADVLADRHDYDEAAPLAARALEILGGEDPSRLADVLLVSARIARGRNDAALALDEARRAVALRESTVGKDHADYGRALDEESAALAGLGRTWEAKELHKKALAILEHALGADHPDVIKAKAGP